MTKHPVFPAEWRPFFEAIIADPHNDAPKLIFADWLEETGNPLGEGIRLALKLKAMPRDAPETHRLRKQTRAVNQQIDRFWQVADEHEIDLFAPGVTDSFYITVDKLLKHSDWIAAHSPDPQIHLTIEDDGTCLQKLDRRLGFERWKFTFRRQPNMNVILQAMRRERFREVDLQVWGGGRNGVTDEGLIAISQNECFNGIEAFKFSGSTITDQGFLSLLRSPFLANVKKIDLNATKITNTSVVELANSHWPAQLEDLGLWLTKATDEAFCEFAHCDLSNLKELAIGAKSPHNVTERGFGAFTHNASLTQLTALHLGDNNHTLAMIEELAGNQRFASLRSLDLTRSSFDDNMAIALAASPYLRNLNYVQIFGYGTPLAMPGLIALVSSPIMRSATNITLGVKAPGDRLEGCQAIADSKYLRELRKLSLMLGEIEDAGIQAIANSNNLPELETLSLPTISESAAVAIGESKTLSKISCLLAKVQDLSPQARATLLERFGENDLHISNPRRR